MFRKGSNDLQTGEKKKKGFFSNPTRVIVSSFALLILAGTVLLMLPFSSKAGHVTGPLEALFTATSATCVTGLVVFDTYVYWSVFGQIVILTLIQLGGLGLVTLTTFFNIAIRKKLGYKRLQLAQESVNSPDTIDAKHLVKMIMVLTFSFELLGAIALSATFVPAFGAEGIYISLFLAISSYCNAGFDILGRTAAFASLTEYASDPMVLIPICLLIICGGLGFVVWQNLFSYHKTKRLLLHTKIVLSISAVFILFGTLAFLVFEWDNRQTIGSMGVGDKLLNSFFQSVTTRTAGFNTIDLESMRGITKGLMIFLMFVGAAPGSTGGGIKVTTFVVLVMTIISVTRGSDETTIRGRKVDKSVVYKALAVTGLAGCAVIIAAGIIYFSTGHAESISTVDAMFESVSAFATVGLSVGVSAAANHISRVALILTMFLGRVGPVSLALSLAMRPGKKKNQVMPEAKILVG